MAQRLGGLRFGAVGAVELLHEARGRSVFNRPERCDHRSGTIGEEAVGEPENTFAAQFAAVAGGAAGQHDHVGAQSGLGDFRDADSAVRGARSGLGVLTEVESRLFG